MGHTPSLEFQSICIFGCAKFTPLKSVKYCKLKVKTFQKTTSSGISTNAIPGPRIFCKLCVTVLCHNNTQLASSSKKFQQKHLKQNEDIQLASYNFKISPWLTTNLPNFFYSFENYIADFLRIMHHAFSGCHDTQQVDILDRAKT